ncbi:MAG TPA: TIGR03620 family F420-dependent LLM class oxidoreductase [Baekduia sp.]|uniref:TIGR03620 family F420-dependent LLM class oxidoreductase n=1 Tax=Baekduia sp. TaxID=2600305 RepID=UPI002D790A30|nr:TIGR03620 family F420-dependent LLM class oxidoreductase [Baekduia sp.]HET6509074.1 TIGR03620 family F420-dependent LLM class oxidoreductase [Baekduia sp.]
MTSVVAQNAGPVGVWTWTLDPRPHAETVELARLVESLGYGALWFKEDFGRDGLAAASVLLAATERLVIANGVASMYARDAVAMRSAQRVLGEAHPGRHLLGVGVSHAAHVEARGQRYGSPVDTATRYLQTMREAAFISPEPAVPTLTLLAALGPRMLDVAARHADGVHAFGITPGHTRAVRAALGPDAFLAPVAPVVLDDDVERGRVTARAYVGLLAGLENYRRAWRRLGFGDEDLAGGGSDRLVDALVAVGDEDVVSARVAAHQDAGADHVAIQFLSADLQTPPAAAWTRYAARLSARG